MKKENDDRNIDENVGESADECVDESADENAGESADKNADESEAQPEANEVRNPKGRRKMWICVAVVCIVVVFVCGVKLSQANEEKRRQQAVAELAEQKATSTPVPDATPMPKATPSPTPTPKTRPAKPTPTPKPRGVNEREIDFAALHEENPDVIGWLEVPGTSVDYPLLSTLDNEYYLHHDFYGEESVYGAIYTDIRNHPNLEDPFIVVYGHNMKDGSMFAGLHAYEDEDFFQENRRVIIYTPEGQLNFEVFAAYKHGDEHLMGSKNYNNPVTMREHLQSIETNDDPNGMVEMGGVTDDDDILALSTCVTDEDENRYVVYARFVTAG